MLIYISKNVIKLLSYLAFFFPFDFVATKACLKYFLW